MAADDDINERIKDAISVLIGDRDTQPISLDILLPLCKKSPEFAIAEIQKHRVALVAQHGKQWIEIADVARKLEWELRGPTACLSGNFHKDQMEINFVQARLREVPEQFGVVDLRIIRDKIHRNTPVHIAAMRLLGTHVVSFVERMQAAPLSFPQDRATLAQRIKDYGFEPQINEALAQADERIEGTGPLDYKEAIGHLRTVYEKIHSGLAKKYVAEKSPKKAEGGDDVPDYSRCGSILDMFKRQTVITEKTYALNKALYGLLSDDDFGAHAISAPREYARLCRNMVVEAAVILLYEFERRMAEPN